MKSQAHKDYGCFGCLHSSHSRLSWLNYTVFVYEQRNGFRTASDDKEPEESQKAINAASAL